MKDELLFCPLGGSGEIGMNMNLFGYGQPSNHKWIMVDIGVTFADDTIPGVDLIYLYYFLHFKIFIFFFYKKYFFY